MMTLDVLWGAVAVVIIAVAMILFLSYIIKSRRSDIHGMRRRIANIEKKRAETFSSLKAQIVRYKGDHNPVVEGMTQIGDEERVDCVTSPADTNAPDGHLTFARLKELIHLDPDIENNPSMQAILDDLDQSEEMLTAIRHDYNEKVQRYNHTIATLPYLLIAKVKSYRPIPYIELKFEEEEVPDLIKLLS